MTHLTMEQLLAIREPGLEPGVQGWRDHAQVCELCRALRGDEPLSSEVVRHSEHGLAVRVLRLAA